MLTTDTHSQMASISEASSECIFARHALLHARARLTTSRWHVEVGEARAWREFERDLTSGIVPEALNKRASKNEDADRSRSDAIGGDMRFARRSFQDT